MLEFFKASPASNSLDHCYTVWNHPIQSKHGHTHERGDWKTGPRWCNIDKTLNIFILSTYIVHWELVLFQNSEKLLSYSSSSSCNGHIGFIRSTFKFPFKSGCRIREHAAIRSKFLLWYKRIDPNSAQHFGFVLLPTSKTNERKNIKKKKPKFSFYSMLILYGCDLI